MLNTKLSSNMNAISLYLSTCKLVMQLNNHDTAAWNDLYRLVPYLRQSLSCTVCSNLAMIPHSPIDGNCQHHVCYSCRNGRKKLKPSCQYCRNLYNYRTNNQLRSLQQCYKVLCKYFKTTAVYRTIFDQAVTSSDQAACNLMELICEGSTFADDYKGGGGFSDYSMLPPAYANRSTAPRKAINGNLENSSTNIINLPSITSTPPGSNPDDSESLSVYSVSSCNTAGSNKLTLKRKRENETDLTPLSQSSTILWPISSGSISSTAQGGLMYTIKGNGAKSTTISQTQNFKKPTSSRSKSLLGKRKGCRCGNATPTPGKLTCCGQRCPCYVDGKACLECRCRGCRNPHRADGVKIRPHIPEIDQMQFHFPESEILHSPDLGVSMETESKSMHTISYATPNVKVIGLYTGDLSRISTTLPSAILMGDDTNESTHENSTASDSNELVINII